ncbi:MAG: CpXC domain-containing protein [Bacteroidales bacterium]|nr:CpXC domain-containing protein [Bacteroidales bacterium]
MKSVAVKTAVTCSSCGKGYEADVYRHIDAQDDPQMKEAVMNGSVFVRECPLCGCRELIKTPVIYRDSHLLLCLSEYKIEAEGLDGLSGRRVCDVGSFIEKVKIFDAGLDDIAVELCKFVTRQEIGKDAELKFLRTDGADNDIIFTYPEDGRMQMLSVGFNVYEDCRAIVERNPSMKAAAQGLALVDRDFVEEFLK